MAARIFKPSKTAMQSGSARTKDWVLEFEPASARVVDPLMGWVSSGDTGTQVKLAFETKDEAIAYATRNGIAFTVTEPAPHKRQNKTYSDNFKFGRIGMWTH
jgi:ETC complex I subunit conserved region